LASVVVDLFFVPLCVCVRACVCVWKQRVADGVAIAASVRVDLEPPAGVCVCACVWGTVADGNGWLVPCCRSRAAPAVRVRVRYWCVRWEQRSQMMTVCVCLCCRPLSQTGRCVRVRVCVCNERVAECDGCAWPVRVPSILELSTGRRCACVRACVREPTVRWQWPVACPVLSLITPAGVCVCVFDNGRRWRRCTVCVLSIL
jgi:hypothetical protein